MLELVIGSIETKRLEIQIAKGFSNKNEETMEIFITKKPESVIFG